MAQSSVETFPVRHTSNIPAIFLENHQVSSEDEKVRYVSSINSFLSATDAAKEEADSKQKIEESLKSTSQNIQTLNDALGNFRNDAIQRGYPDTQRGTSNNKIISWSDVMQEFQRAQNHYQGRYSSRPVAKALSKFGKHASSLQRWLDVLPAGDYGSSACGAMKLILSAADGTYELDKTVFQALSDIPEIIYNARHYLEAYSLRCLSIVILERMADLCNHVLLVLIGIIQYCRESIAKHMLSVFAKGKNAKEALKLTITDLKGCAEDLDREAQRIDRQALHGIAQKMDEGSHTNVMVHLYVLMSGHPNIDGKGQIIPDIASQLNLPHEINLISAASSPGLEGIQLTPSPSAADLFSLAQSPSSRSLDGTQLTPSSSAASQFSIAQSPSSPSPKVHRHKHKDKPVTDVKKLLNTIAFDDVLVSRDIGTNLLPDSFDEEQLHKLSFVTSASRFQSWSHGAQKQYASLLIQGHFDSITRTSALTHLCAKIAYQSSQQDMLVLSHFCGLHADSWDPRGNATGLIISFIGQLLSHHSVDFDVSAIDEESLGLIEMDDFEELCRLFGMLIRQVPRRMTVLCIIDTISAYETPDLSRKTSQLVATIQYWVGKRNDRHTRPRMKLLVTDPNRANEVWRYFDGGDIVDISEDESDDSYLTLED